MEDAAGLEIVDALPDVLRSELLQEHNLGVAAGRDREVLIGAQVRGGADVTRPAHRERAVGVEAENSGAR